MAASNCGTTQTPQRAIQNAATVPTFLSARSPHDAVVAASVSG
jgi:hypothetical protein